MHPLHHAESRAINGSCIGANGAPAYRALHHRSHWEMLGRMWLPVPTPKMVDEFRALVRREFQLELTEAEALDLATRFLQIYFLKTYAYRDLRPQIVRE